MPELEFCLAAEDVPRLLRMPPFARRGSRAAAFDCIWHDTATGELAAAGLSLAESKGMWRLERATPRPGEAWPPGTPAPLLAAGPDPASLDPAVAGLRSPLMPVAGFHGHRRLIRVTGADPVTLCLTDGLVRSVATEQRACRIVLTGSATRLMALSADLVTALPITVPRWSMAEAAIALARRTAPPSRRSGGPEVSPHATVSDAVALIIGHLADVMLAAVPGVCAGETPEPVHAMRVALRRLRSAMSMFRRAADGPAFAMVRQQLPSLSAALGTARDWDVFLAGTGQDVAAAIPGDRRIEAMLAAAHKQREAAYATLRQVFASAEFRQLAVSLVQLAALRPWEREADADQAALLQQDAAGFSAQMFARRHEHMLAPGSDISGLLAEELHELRKKGKRLRYAAEFFAPLHGRRGVRRFVRRVSALQEALGHLNDGAAAAGLMHALRGGPDRQFAAGAVQGFAAAQSLPLRNLIARRWSKFRRTEPFWT